MLNVCIFSVFEIMVSDKTGVEFWSDGNKVIFVTNVVAVWHMFYCLHCGCTFMFIVKLFLYRAIEAFGMSCCVFIRSDV